MGELESDRGRDLESFCKAHVTSLPDVHADEEDDEDELDEIEEDMEGEDEELPDAEDYEVDSEDEDYERMIANVAELQREKIELDLKLMSLYHRIESLTEVLTLSINHVSSRAFLSSQQLATARASFPIIWGRYSLHFKDKVRAKIQRSISDVDNSKHWNDIVSDIVNQPSWMADLGLSEESLRVTEIALSADDKPQGVAGLRGRTKKVFAAVACWCRDEQLRKCYVEFFHFLFGREEDPNQFVTEA
eukprot:TRINITY_DN4050_c0_g1_i1.p1 TRINITY_DN4050_c0_g1~~TRINITY_DN4050_c0_g1_i1.p1  ORF type:complete len:247 (+),score=56.00 TRINITY_DN4050_c0_g1_i1:616-1356(+)